MHKIWKFFFLHKIWLFHSEKKEIVKFVPPYVACGAPAKMGLDAFSVQIRCTRSAPVVYRLTNRKQQNWNCEFSCRAHHNADALRKINTCI